MSCKTINIDLTNVPPVPIQIGVAGENSFRTITFDASKWGADYPDATYTVVYRRSDGYLYPVLVNASADAIVWNPTGTDTAVSGNGQLEVRLLDGETIGKTIIMQTYVAPSLSGDESEPSTPAPDWVNDVADDADRAELATSHYPKIVNGVWYVWSVPDGDFVSTGIEAQGEDGYSPTVTVTEIEGGHRVMITDADGAHTFDVMDGEGGSGGGAVDSVNGQTGVVVLDASDVGALPANTPIPSAVTEQTVSGWGFTKNTGTYSKPSGGIPKTDLASAVQTSLGKADTALQSAPVSSVNNKTGVVSLNASDVGATPEPLEIPVTESDGTYSTTVTAEQIRAAKENSVFVFNGEDRIKASLWLTWDEGVELLIGMQKFGSTITAVAANVAGNSVSIGVEQTPIPTAVSELTNDSGYQTAQDVATAIAAAAELPSGGTTGDFLRKTASGVAWETVPTYTGGSY